MKWVILYEYKGQNMCFTSGQSKQSLKWQSCSQIYDMIIEFYSGSKLQVHSFH